MQNLTIFAITPILCVWAAIVSFGFVNWLLEPLRDNTASPQIAIMDRIHAAASIKRDADEARPVLTLASKDLDEPLAEVNLSVPVGYEKLVVFSDDFQTHREKFAIAAKQLVESGLCSESEFLRTGGFVRSGDRSEYYFLFCKGKTTYLNVRTGRIE